MDFPIIIASLTIFLAGAIAWWTIPRVVEVVNRRNLFDAPDGDRKLHTQPTPVMGGVGIFLGFIVVLVAAAELLDIQLDNFFRLSIIGLLFVGIYDDLLNVSARCKLMVQIAAACLVLYESAGWISHFNGVFGIQSVPLWLAIPLSAFVIVLIINAYNMIDGVDGLASSQGAIASLLFGTFFYVNGDIELSLISFALTGALGGFLLHNRPPARIFMGDTGSLVVGFVLGFLAVEFVAKLAISPVLALNDYTPVLVVAILIVPLYDILRVVIIRKRSGRPAFSPGRDHIHHVLQDYDFGARGVSAYLATVQFLVFMAAYTLAQFEVDINIVLAAILLSAAVVLPFRPGQVPMLSWLGWKPRQRPTTRVPAKVAFTISDQKQPVPKRDLYRSKAGETSD